METCLQCFGIVMWREGRIHHFCDREEGASTKAREIIRLKPTDLQRQFFWQDTMIKIITFPQV